MNNVQTLLAYSVTRRVVYWVAARAWFMIFFAVVFPLAWPQEGVVMSMQPRPWPDVPELTADGWSSEPAQVIEPFPGPFDHVEGVEADLRLRGLLGGRPTMERPRAIAS